MKLIKNSNGVSHVIGYLLTLSLTAVVITAASLTTNTLVTQKTNVSVEAYAESIANRVADAIINCYLVKEKYPELSYTRTLEIPTQLINKNYYITVDDDNVYVKTNDGNINVVSTLYNVDERLLTEISGKVYGGSDGLTIFCDKYDYVHKIDFGEEYSDTTLGYKKITNISDGPDAEWTTNNYGDWKYRIPIGVNNPIGALSDYQILVQLTEKNFNYDDAEPDGSDLRFRGDLDGTGTFVDLDYWIERWNPSDTHTSRIWVKTHHIDAGDGDDDTFDDDTFYMYYGKSGENAQSYGVDTFPIFFDDFNEAELSADWLEYPTAGDISILDSMAVLENGEELLTAVGITAGGTDCVIEAKAKALGGEGGIREASLFAGSDGGQTPYSNGGYVLSSGYFPIAPQNNLAIIKNNGAPSSATGNPAVDKDWNRLSLIINGGEYNINRYEYDSFSTTGSTTLSDVNTNKQFGLCVRSGDVDSIAYYDWILVRQYAADDIDGDVPTVKLQGTHSSEYQWVVGEEPTGSIDRSGTGNDIVYVDNEPDGSATLKISNLFVNQEYSLTFLVGDVKGETDTDYLVENMKINIYDDAANLASDPDIDCNPTKKVFFPSVTPIHDGTIYIEFDDADDDPNDPDYYWAVSEMTIQNGERKILLQPGGR